MDKEYKFGEVLITEEQIHNRVVELGKQISKDYQGEEILLVGILRGSVLFLSDLMRAISADTKIDFMAVSSYGASTKSTGVVKINKDLESSIEGLHVIVVEDIVDTGITLHYLKTYLQDRLPKSLKVCTFLDKPERRQVNIEADYVGFEVDNKFIIGYGLDYGQKYRNLPYITCLEEI
ncbi:MAG: hypoxanthine phosphoribosyltransferase [Anaerovorax sp.]